MYCAKCGKPLDPSARFCSFCGDRRDGVAGPSVGVGFPARGQLMRARTGRMIAGVCAGFAEHYGWDLNLVRILSVVVTLFTGVTLFAYLAAWIIIPEGQYALPFGAVPPPPMTNERESATL